MTTLKYLLTFTSGVLITLCAWMVLGGADPNCKLIAIDHQQIEALRANFAHSERNNMILVSQLAEERLKKVSSLEREVESIKVLAAQVKPVEQAVKVSPHEAEQTRADGVVLWLRDSLNQAKTAWRGAMRVP